MVFYNVLNPLTGLFPNSVNNEWFYLDFKVETMQCLEYEIFVPSIKACNNDKVVRYKFEIHNYMK